MKWLLVVLAACGDDPVHHLADGACTDCDQVQASFAGLAWKLPCGTSVTSTECQTLEQMSTAMVMGGSGRYQVQLHLQGVVEQKTYDGGTTDGYWNVGGTPGADGYNIYALTVSSPQQTYYLNAGTSTQFRSFAIDYMQTIAVDAGATLSLEANPIDGDEIKNVDDQLQPITAPNATLVQQPYDGQFIQLDAVSITAA